MSKRSLALITAIALAVTFAGTGNAADSAGAKPENSKDKVYTGACPPSCGFSVKSHDRAEVVAMLKEHGKTHHNMTLSDKEADKLIKEKGAKEKDSKEG